MTDWQKPFLDAVPIKPYHVEKAGIIWCADCKDILPQLPKVDLVLTDPPYDEYTHRGALVKSEKFKEFGVSFDNLDNFEFVKLCLIKCIGWIIIFCGLEMLGKYQSLANDKYVRGGVWDRISNAPQISGDRPAQGAEGVAIFHSIRKNMKWNGGGKAAIWRHLVERNEKKHPTQKPISLFKELTSLFSNEHNLILDPFLGSGTTAVAAKELGRKFIGIEIEEKYCEIAVKRLRQGVFDFE